MKSSKQLILVAVSVLCLAASHVRADIVIYDNEAAFLSAIDPDTTLRTSFDDHRRRGLWEALLRFSWGHAYLRL